MRLVALAAAVAIVWILAGIRQIDSDREFGVLDGWIPGPFPVKVDGRWSTAPPGLLRLHRYSRLPQEIGLPDAERAMLPGAGGTRFGFRGWVSVRADPQQWRKVHHAAADGGIEDSVAEAAIAAGEGIDSGISAGLGGRRIASDFSVRLASELERRGLVMGRLGLDSLDYLTAEPGTDLADPGTRLLVVGLDGADWAILDPLMEQGRLPNLKKLVDGGVRAKLLSLSPMLSPVIWTTAATGVEPSRHGILDFLVHDDDGTEKRQPVTSAQRKVPAVWEILGDAGFSTGVVAWWATWPADPVNGYLVSDRVAYQLFNFRSDPDDAEGKTWPPDLYDEIRPLIVQPDEIPWERVVPFLSGGRSEREEFDAAETELLDNFRTLLASTDTYVDLAVELAERFRPRFEAVYLEGTDTAGHLFMRYRPPRLPGVNPARYDSFREIVDRYYEVADQHLGRLLEGRGEETTVMVLSDHGFACDATRPRTAESTIGHGQAAMWHRRFGVLILNGKAIRDGVRLEEATMFDIAPTILALFGRPVPRSWPGKVLAGAIAPDFLDRHPVRYRLEDPVRTGGVEHEGGGEIDREMVEKLKSLGYISEESPEPDSITFSNNSGVALMAEGDYAGAEESFRQGLAAHPGHPMLQANLGLALRFQGRLEEAREVLESAIRHPNARRMAGHHIAQICLSGGDLECAERYLREVLESEPDADEILNALGLVMERKGETGAAAELYRRAADLDPDAAMPRNNLGNIARRQGEDDDAERWYLEAIEADPYFMGAYNNLALVYQDRGELDRAIDLYARALEKQPTHEVVLNNLASLYFTRADYEEAKKLWSRSVRANPGYVSPYNNLAGIAIVQGRYEDAEELLRQALEIDPGYGDASINLAIVHRTLGRAGEARAELKRAMEDPRARSQALLQIGFLELQQGHFARAAALLEEARPEFHRLPDLHNGLGEAYLRLGETLAAIDAFEESLRLDPTQSAIRRRLEEIVETEGN